MSLISRLSSKNRTLINLITVSKQLNKSTLSVAPLPSQLPIPPKKTSKRETGKEKRDPVARLQSKLERIAIRKGEVASSPKRPRPRNVAILSHIAQSLGASFLLQHSLRETPEEAVEELLPFQARRVVASLPVSGYLVDPSVAKQFISLVKKKGDFDFTADTPAIEIAPGLGILTRHLLEDLRLKSIVGFEDSGKFAGFLKEEFVDGSLKVVGRGFSELPRLHHIDKIDGGSRVSELLEQVPVGLEKPNLLIFGAILHGSFINFLIRLLATSRVFYDPEFGWKDPVYFAALGSRAYWILGSSRESGLVAYRPSSVLFQVLFKHTVLGTLPRKAWVPWTNESSEGKSVKYKLRNNYDPEIVHVVKIETNQEAVDKIGRDNLIYFWYFVRQHLFSRRKGIVAELEKWIPGCGARLIRKGFTIYSQFGELTPPQILDLYLEFVSWPEFHGCSFISAVEKYQARIELQEDEVH